MSFANSCGFIGSSFGLLVPILRRANRRPVLRMNHIDSFCLYAELWLFFRHVWRTRNAEIASRLAVATTTR